MAKNAPVTELEQVQEAAQETGSGENFVRYRVRCPGGVHLRVGPGQAYRSAAILTFGTEILGEDVSALLREDRTSGASAWLRIPCAEGSGWVDGAYLERVDEPAE